MNMTGAGLLLGGHIGRAEARGRRGDAPKTPVGKNVNRKMGHY